MVDPYLLPGGRRGCLVIHGFAGDPGEVLPLGRALAQDGMTVLGLTLPGHSGRPADLAPVRREDWLQALIDGYDALSGRCDTIVAAGFSLGGALAVLLAAARPVERLALLATPDRLAVGWREWTIDAAAALGGWYRPYERADFSRPDVRHALQRRLGGSVNLDDAAVQQQIRAEARVALSAVAELRDTLRELRRTAPAVTAPVLIQHGRHDTIVPVAAAYRLAQLIGSARRELVIREQSGHFLLDDGEGLEVIQRTCGFLGE
jgi:carboxylesterase